MAMGAFFPLAIYSLMAGSVGFRLAGLWRRTRGVPEGSLALGLLFVTFSLPLSATGRVPALATLPFGRTSFALGLTLTAVGLSLFAYFNLYVFRRESTWARLLFVALCIGMYGGVAYMSAANFTGESVAVIKVEMMPGTLTLMGALLGCFIWGAVESFLCHAAARRRLAIGLGDAVVVNRFLLWGLASVASGGLLLVVIVCILAGMVILRAPIPLAAMAACGTVMSACWYLTFFSPERYRRFVLARTGD